MPSFTKDGFRTPFGRNVYLRSTQDVKTKSHMCYAPSVPLETIDGFPGQRVLQPGTVMALITSGSGTGMVGPFQAVGTDEVQTITPTTVTAGTFAPTILGVTMGAQAFNITAANFQIAIRAAIAASSASDVYKDIGANITVTGGPLNSGAFVVTFNGTTGQDVPAITVDQTALTGTVAVTTGTPGVSGASDGRQTTTNIVGFNNTFLPWQLTEGNREIAVVYEASVVQANCIELNAAGTRIACQNATATAMIGQKALDIRFH